LAALKKLTSAEQKELSRFLLTLFCILKSSLKFLDNILVNSVTMMKLRRITSAEHVARVVLVQNRYKYLVGKA
jgi:hypothetical protein